MSVEGKNNDKYDQDLDLEEEQKTYTSCSLPFILFLLEIKLIVDSTKRLEKIKAAKMDAEFPDEVDTPRDQPARVRFQK